MKKLKFISKMVFVFTLIVGGLLISNCKSFASDTALISKGFSVWDKNGVVGYDVGFSLVGASTFNTTQSIVVQLYSGNTLLQTNTAIHSKITGNEFVTPFDVFGTFDYQKDGYFTNKKEAEYGQKLSATKAVAIVTLLDGTVLTATNTKLTGDTSTIGVTPIVGQILGAESFYFTQLIKTGSNGAEVIELQKFLNNNGYDCGVTDGKFGPKTETAVINFQSENKLVGDGVVGPLTRNILNK